MKRTIPISVGTIITIGVLSSNLYAKEKLNLDKVTVTANKIEENLQDVPQSISIIDETLIEEKGITDIKGIIKEIPNMTDIPDHGIMVNFRGLNSSMFTNNNPVVIYIDGVPTTERMAYDISLANVEKVEVLRGPQGTLYGKDAIGAVINILTKDPTNEHQGSFAIEAGKDNHLLNTFNINGPIDHDKWFYGFNMQLKNEDGWITNELKDDHKANRYMDKKYSGYILYKPTDQLRAKWMASSYNTKKRWGKNHTLSGTSDLNEFKRSNAENVSFEVPTFEHIKTHSQSLSINYNFEPMQLDWITTYKKLDLDSDFDMDFGNGLTFNGLKQFNYTDSKTWTQEIRLSNSSENLKWVTGVYWDDENREQGPYGVQSPMSGGIEQNAVSESDSNTQAIFGQAIIPLGNDFELTLGGRYQKITKDIDLDMYMLPLGTTGSPSFTLKDKQSWNTFIPKAALAYKINENLTSFLSVSKGYMPGGYNYFASSGTTSDNSFDPQKSINYELGLKGLIGDISFTASVFRMDIKDIHVFKIDSGMYLTDNAQKAHSEGLEFDFTYFPNDEWEISGAVGLIRAKYDDYDAGTTKYDGEKIENTPSHTANLSVAYNNPQGYYGRLNIKNAGSTSFSNAGNNKFESQSGHTSADIRIGYRFSDFDLYAYMNNITDEEYITSYKNNGMYGVATFNDPRTFGLGLRYKF